MKKKILLSILCILLVGTFTIIKMPKNELFRTTINAKNYNDPPKISYITSIAFSYDTDKIVFSPAYTYREFRKKFEDNWRFPEESTTGKGHNNIGLLVCPTAAKCDLAETERINSNEQYDSHIENKYTYAEFEIYPADGNCFDDDTICDYDFNPEHLDEIEVWINGVKRDDAIIGDYYNTYWHEVDIYIPLTYDDSPLVKSVTVTSDTDSVQKGTTSQFTANIDYYGEEAKNITWSIIDATSTNTTISSTGLLSVGADEESNYITIRATSTYDNTVYGSKKVTIIDEPLSITSVSIRQKDTTVVYGGIFTFICDVAGTGNHDVIWSITGANNPGTTIDTNGKLTIDSEETAKNISVIATNVFDPSKKDMVTVTTRATEIIKKIEINYDTEAAVFSSKTTYNDARNILKRVWNLPEDAGYDKGNNNIWFVYCDTDERCINPPNSGYSENMLLGKYTYAEFEIYAKPSSNSNMLNPLYDFDSEHLDEIEVWVNGVKRNDAFVYNYNDSWREIRVFVPVTITDGKLAQYFDFYNDDPYYLNYGSEPSKKSMRDYARIGDGEITYTSSNPEIATIDEEGNVTPKKVGTVTITAKASETEDYKEFSASYILIVEPQYIYPSISEYEYTQYYTGSPIHPEFSVTINGGETTLVEGVDYTTEYGENINVGSGQIYINSVEGSNYKFASPRGVNFYINRRTITAEDITIDKSKMVYTGEYLRPNVTIEVLGKKLEKDTDYTISYSSNLNVGTAYISIYGTGNYTGYVPLTFEIIEPPVYEKGDINQNEKIDLGDIILALKKYLGLEEATPEEITLIDMDEDGSLTLKDIISLLKSYLGIE